MAIMVGSQVDKSWREGALEFVSLCIARCLNDTLFATFINCLFLGLNLFCPFRNKC